VIKSLFPWVMRKIEQSYSLTIFAFLCVKYAYKLYIPVCMHVFSQHRNNYSISHYNAL